MKQLITLIISGTLLFITQLVYPASLFQGEFNTGSAELKEAEYVVQVSLDRQEVYVFCKGEKIRQMTCSSGLPLNDNNTPSGRFIINETGKKKGLWFYSKGFEEGAEYWVGFIGGIYLFHSVPMDRNRQIIAEEEKLLGQPASHGCIRLSVDDAKWFYETIPSGSVLYIQGTTPGTPPEYRIQPPVHTKEEVSNWLVMNHMAYYQKYLLSCEAALERTVLAFCGIDLEEDEILASYPKGSDPETSFVCENINRGRRTADGTILWDNYGTHPPVVVENINHWLKIRHMENSYSVQEEVLTDLQLKKLCREDDTFLGAIVWLIGHPERWGETPPANERGMVLGEHVRFIDPQLDQDGNFMVWDPEYHGDLPYHREELPDRVNFQNRVVVVRTLSE